MYNKCGSYSRETAILGFDACFPDSVLGFNAYSNKTSNFFMKYYLEIMKLKMKKISEGTNRENLSLEKLLSIKMLIPDLGTQKKIEIILKSYDDSIENNLRRINLLQDLLKTTYDEWFVHFRFRDHRTTLGNCGTNGLKGWRRGDFSKHVDLQRGVEPGSSKYMYEETSNSIPFLRVGDLSKRSSEIHINKSHANGKTCKNSDILLSLDGSPGLVKFGLSGAYSSGIRKALIKNDSFSPAFVYCYLNSAPVQSLIDAHSIGTTILHAGSAVKYMQILCPPRDILERFNNKMMPCFSLMLNLLNQNQILAEARDILLPRLMTGMIDVENYEPAQLIKEVA